jgi:hypothetical protein
MQRGAISAFTRVFDALWRNGAPLIRGRTKAGVCDGPGSAMHRFALHRIRDTSRCYPFKTFIAASCTRLSPAAMMRPPVVGGLPSQAVTMPPAPAMIGISGRMS